MFNLDKLLRRLLPIICLGVLGNLAFAWFASDHKIVGFSGFSIWWLLVAMLLALLPWAWHTLRLAIWGRFFGVEIPWKNLFRIAVATDVGGVVMPAAVGGAPLKMTMLVQQGYRPGQAATLTLWGSVEDVLFYTMAIPVSLALTKNWDNPLWVSVGQFFKKNNWAAAAVLLGILVLLLIFKKLVLRSGLMVAWRARFHKLLSECRAAFGLIMSRGRKPFIWSLLANSAQWLTRFGILLAVVQMLGLEADMAKLLLLQWMVFVAMLVTPVPGATGGAEAAFLLIFSGSLPVGMTGMAMLGWRVLTYYFILVVGAVYLVFQKA
jgi:glycosyltransferase 2 family protein